MAYGEYESYFIKEEELYLVLAGAGLTSWYGLTADHRRETDETLVTTEDVNRILASLYQKNFVEWTGGMVNVLEPLSTLTEIIKRSKWCLQIEMPDSDVPLRGCYSYDDKVVMMEKSRWEQEILRFSIWEQESFIQYLWETGVFPEEEIEEDAQMEGVSEVTKSIVSLREKNTGLENSRMVVTEAGVFPYMSLWEDFEMKKQPYNRAQCKETLVAWLLKQ